MTIVCIQDKITWDKFENEFDKEQIRWRFFETVPTNALERVLVRLKLTNLARMISCYWCVRSIKENPADLLVSHGPSITFWCAIYIRMLGIKINQISFGLNFTPLPKRLKYALMKFAFRKVDKFVVYSSEEALLYNRVLAIPKTKIDFVRWGVGVPHVPEDEKPVIKGEYVCSMGYNYRDFDIIVEAARQISEVKIVLIVGSRDLKKLIKGLPQNVNVYADIDISKALNILKYSKFMILSLKGDRIAAGHVTLVAAMHMGKAAVVSKSPYLNDYLLEGETALTFKCGDIDSLLNSIKHLWFDNALCGKLGENGRSFASQYCSEKITVDKIKEIVKEFGSKSADETIAISF